MPLNLPYYSSTAGYERIDGEINLEGKFYNYVKRKVSKDTLYILYIPNAGKEKLKDGQSEYASRANDLPSEKQQSNVKKCNLLAEYETNDFLCHLVSPAPQSSSHGGRFISRLTIVYPDSSFQPPDALA